MVKPKKHTARLETDLFPIHSLYQGKNATFFYQSKPENKAGFYNAADPQRKINRVFTSCLHTNRLP